MSTNQRDDNRDYVDDGTQTDFTFRTRLNPTKRPQSESQFLAAVDSNEMAQDKARRDALNLCYARNHSVGGLLSHTGIQNADYDMEVAICVKCGALGVFRTFKELQAGGSMTSECHSGPDWWLTPGGYEKLSYCAPAAMRSPTCFGYLLHEYMHRQGLDQHDVADLLGLLPDKIAENGGKPGDLPTRPVPSVRLAYVKLLCIYPAPTGDLDDWAAGVSRATSLGRVLWLARKVMEGR